MRQPDKFSNLRKISLIVAACIITLLVSGSLWSVILFRNSFTQMGPGPQKPIPPTTYQQSTTLPVSPTPVATLQVAAAAAPGLFIYGAGLNRWNPKPKTQYQAEALWNVPFKATPFKSVTDGTYLYILEQPPTTFQAETDVQVIRISDGTTIGTQTLAGTTPADIVLFNNALYVAVNTASAPERGEIYLVDLKATQKQQIHSGEPIQDMAVSDGLLAIGTRPAKQTLSGDSFLRAYSLPDAEKEIWNKKFSGTEMGYSKLSSLHVFNQTLYAAILDERAGNPAPSYIAAFNMKTDAPLWQTTPTNRQNITAVTIVQSIVYMSSYSEPATDGKVSAYQAPTGSKIWEQPVTGHPTKLIVNNGTLYTGGDTSMTGDNAPVAAISLGGVIKWQRQVAGGDTVANMVLVEDRLWLRLERNGDQATPHKFGRLVSLDTTNQGNEAWSSDSGGAGPTILEVA